MNRSNLVLIGMPAAGKSTVGRLLATRLARPFVDTDAVLAARTGRALPELMRREGLSGFRQREEEAVLALTDERAVIATGGSVVYSAPAMQRLRERGWVVFLDVPLAELSVRVGDPRARGMVIAPGQSFAELFAERRPLYRRYADVCIDCSGLAPAAVAERVLADPPWLRRT